METRFAGKRALVTGAGKGIGKATALKLAAQGATVVALSRTQADLDALCKENPAIIPLCVDLEDTEATKAAVGSLCPIDLLVSNAGVALLQPFLETDVESWDRTMSANVRSALVVGQVVGRSMVAEGKGGSIVHVSSQGSQMAIANHAAYCASKGALDQLTRVMALELGPHKIRVNAVNPTVVMTDMGRIGWSDPAKAAPMLSRIPLGRFAEVVDVVDPILFLLSNESQMLNGVTLPIDGGVWST
eukprot:comp23451_c0_seq1/m.39130 comp23451_c0_seq1/g.39130  ORF comp23451_c0_seq1/g.39130 comp23451_c0_seq1/m.39130 type:complete len:245 (-) comp23451_c0_seq1:245-979(-)